MFEIYACEMGYPTVGFTDNIARTIYKSWKVVKENKGFYTEFSIGGEWYSIPEYENIVDFYERTYLKTGTIPGIDGIRKNRRWGFKKIESY